MTTRNVVDRAIPQIRATALAAEGALVEGTQVPPRVPPSAGSVSQAAHLPSTLQAKVPGTLSGPFDDPRDKPVFLTERAEPFW